MFIDRFTYPNWAIIIWSEMEVKVDQYVILFIKKMLFLCEEWVHHGDYWSIVVRANGSRVKNARWNFVALHRCRYWLLCWGNKSGFCDKGTVYVQCCLPLAVDGLNGLALAPSHHAGKVIAVGKHNQLETCWQKQFAIMWSRPLL